MEKKAVKEKKVKETKNKAAVAAQNNEKDVVYAIRGNIFDGKVTSAKANKTVTVERELIQYLPKYERYKKIKSKLHVHNPSAINAKEGDIVRVGETRRISKTKNFVVMEIIKKAGEKQ